MNIVETLYCDSGTITILTDGVFYYVKSNFGIERVRDYATAKSIAMEM